MEILERESRVELEEEQACYQQIKFNFKQWEQQNASRINFINKLAGTFFPLKLSYAYFIFNEFNFRVCGSFLLITVRRLSVL